MTMIACTLNDQFPIIHSDILITGTDKLETFYVPALTSNLMEVLPKGKLYHPAGLKRKVTLLNDRICFAFAGDVAEAEKLLEDLKIYCRVMGNVTKDQLFDEVQKRDISDELDFFIVVMEAAGEGYVPQIIYYNQCRIIDIPVFGKTLLLGSGGDDFLKAATQVVWPLSNIPTSPVEAVQTDMAMITGILSSERVDQHTFRNWWGAGIETIYWDGERFANLQEVSFVFHHWFRNTEHDVGHPVPVKVTHYKYIDDMLFIVDVVSANWKKKVVEDKFIFDLEEPGFGLFVVGSIDDKRSVDWAKLRDHISFSSMFVGMGYIITDGNRLLGPSGFHGARDVSVEYRHKSSLRIEVRRELYDRIGSVFNDSAF